VLATDLYLKFDFYFDLTVENSILLQKKTFGHDLDGALPILVVYMWYICSISHIQKDEAILETQLFEISAFASIKGMH